MVIHQSVGTNHKASHHFLVLLGIMVITFRIESLG